MIVFSPQLGFADVLLLRSNSKIVPLDTAAILNFECWLVFLGESIKKNKSHGCQMEIRGKKKKKFKTGSRKRQAPIQPS